MTSKTRTFQEVAAGLFKRLGMRDNPADEQSDGYTITVGESLRIEVIGLQAGYVNLLAAIGVLPDNASAPQLLTMLQANRFTFEHPPICIGVAPQGAKIMLSARQPLIELDDAAMWALYTRFADSARSVRRWLDAGENSEQPVRGAVSRNQARLNRMLGSK
jgi:hypothetical protein